MLASSLMVSIGSLAAVIEIVSFRVGRKFYEEEAYEKGRGNQRLRSSKMGFLR